MEVRGPSLKTAYFLQLSLFTLLWLDHHVRSHFGRCVCSQYLFTRVYNKFTRQRVLNSCWYMRLPSQRHKAASAATVGHCLEVITVSKSMNSSQQQTTGGCMICQESERDCAVPWTSLNVSAHQVCSLQSLGPMICDWIDHNWPKMAATRDIRTHRHFIVTSRTCPSYEKPHLTRQKSAKTKSVLNQLPLVAKASWNQRVSQRPALYCS